MKVCKNCGEINAGDAAFCSNCGGSTFVVQEEVNCSHCGAANDPSFTHCVNCGADLPRSERVQTDERSPQPVSVNQNTREVYANSSAVVETSKCPSCGTDVPLTSMYCFKCGASVATIHEHRVVQRKICPHCGRPNPQDSHFCSYCYCSLAEAKTENLQVVHDHRVLEEGAVRQVFLESISGKSIVCPNCGSLNKPEEAFCVNCGLKLIIDEPRKYCPSCGAENAVDSKFCSKCNYSLEEAKPEDSDKWNCKFCGCDNEQENVYCSTCGRKRKK